MKKSLLVTALALLICTASFAQAADKDVVDTAVAAGQFNTLAAALKAADLVETLKGPGPFTVFAPRTKHLPSCRRVRLKTCSSLKTRRS